MSTMKRGQGARHRLVLRLYHPNEEKAAFMRLLENPSLNHADVLKTGWASEKAAWHFHLSATFWLLVVLRSKAAPSDREPWVDDNHDLQGLRQRIEKDPKLEDLRAVATGKMTWRAFKDAGAKGSEMINGMQGTIIHATDLLCTTPAMTHNNKYIKYWKTEAARGIAVDEAANMNRADLCCIWGNTLLPCFLGGDPKQFSPTVVSNNEKDAEGNLRHLFADDGKISSLLFFQATGMPTYRLRVQLRMANSLFDSIAREIYPEVPYTYADSCNVTLAKFASGRALEAYVQEKYPGVMPAAPGKLSPIFVHCEGSKVHTDELTGSKRSHDQVKIALDFTADFIKAKKIDAARIVILTPYRANVDLITKMRTRPEYLAILSAMAPASTIDGYQGQECDIVIVVIGTAYPKPGPGFTDGQRLNVMFTRQRCGLVLVGDINASGPLEEDKGNDKNKGKGQGKGKGATKTQERFQVEGANGQRYWTKAMTLRNLYTAVHQSGRVIRINVKPNGADGCSWWKRRG